MLIAALLLAVCTAPAEPVKWLDGTVTEATAWKLNPSTVELTTPRGKIVVPASKLPSEWLTSKFPNSGHAQANKGQLDVSVKAVETILKLTTDKKALEAENAKLKAELAKYTGSTQPVASGLAISDVGVRKIKEGYGHVTFSWKARITNKDSKPADTWVRISGRDSDDFEVFHDLEEIDGLAPGESRLLTGESMTTESTWRAHKKVVATAK